MSFDGLNHLKHEFIVPDTRPSLLQQFNARRNSFHDLECFSVNVSKSSKSSKSSIEDIKTRTLVGNIKETITKTETETETAMEEVDSISFRKFSVCSDSYKEPVFVNNRYKDLFQVREFRSSTVTETKPRCDTISTCESQLTEPIVVSTKSNKRHCEKKLFNFSIFSSMKNLLTSASSKCSSKFKSTKADDIEFFELFPTAKSEMSDRENFSMKWDKNNNSIKSFSIQTGKNATAQEQINIYNTSKKSIAVTKIETNSSKIMMAQNPISRKNPVSTKSTKLMKHLTFESENESFGRSSLPNCTG